MDTKVIALTYEVSCLASLERLQATLAEITRTTNQTRTPDPQRLKYLAHRFLTSRSASGKFKTESPMLPPLHSTNPLTKHPWLLIGLLDNESTREVNPSDISQFLSTQTGCISAVECHPNNLEEVTAAFRPAIKEAHRQSKAKRSQEERALEERRWTMEEERKLSEQERRREAQSAVNRMRQFEQWFEFLAQCERKGRL
jgi:hypothetical protein